MECKGANVKEAEAYLRSKTVDMNEASYWYPDFPTFPAIDAVMYLPTEKTVQYIQITVAVEHELDFSMVNHIHGLVKESLGLEDINEWTFQYIAIGSSRENANALKLLYINVVEDFEMIISTGYVTHLTESRGEDN